MDARDEALEKRVPAAGLLGYLNFSDGRPDPRWQKQVNEAYAWLDQQGEPAPWSALLAWLRRSLDHLQGTGAAAFRDTASARSVLDLTEQTLVAYRSHHRDLLAHLDDRDLFGPFFVARVAEAILGYRANNGEEPAKDTVSAVLFRLNDFVGYRPLALLETRPQGEPYPHERHRPLPLYLRGVGAAHGLYQSLVRRALEILSAIDPSLLAEAHFDLAVLEELAVDQRAYDHGHPVNRRSNYVFGEWDPHHIDSQGRYCRYVARRITLDALLDRVTQAPRELREEYLLEAAVVLGGTILMATGVSGASATAHDSTVTLAKLLPRIARYRDAYYEKYLAKLTGPHGERLRQERTATRQPFGGARQHLNTYLARHRATQLQQRYLSVLFAEMGYPEASRAEARRIPTVSTRLLSEILGQLATGQLEIEQGKRSAAALRLPEIEDLLRRGIDCGAFADPWNIIGFQGLFPLSPAREDSMRDPRLEELLQVIEQLFHLSARLTCEAAASGETGLVQKTLTGLKQLASWWDRFATTEVSDLRKVSGAEAASSAKHVASALSRWNQSNEGPADLSFWRSQLEHFRSPKAYSLVVDTLLRKGDYRAALALLISWLGQAEQVPLEDGSHSFHNLTLRWMLSLTHTKEVAPGEPEAGRLDLRQRREMVAKFFDVVEANAEEFWEVPILREQLHMPRVAEDVPEPDAETDAEPEEPPEKDLYSAAYEEVTYRDSTGNDAEGAIADGGPLADFELEDHASRLEKRLRFLSTLARLWQIAARFLAATESADPPSTPREGLSREKPRRSTHATILAWLEVARERQGQLLGLLDAIHTTPLPEPTGDYESLIEYDRRRVLKEGLLSTTIGTCLDMTLAVGALQGVSAADQEPEDWESQSGWGSFVIRLEQGLFRGDDAGVRSILPLFLQRFQQEPLLYAPLSEGGAPRQILRVRIAQTILRALLANLPRLGLLRDTFDLLRSARAMEKAHPVQGRGFTEFYQFFQTAYQSVIESVIDSAATWPDEQGADTPLVALLERLTAPFLSLWIDHSRALQLSTLETLQSDADWQGLQRFVQRYGNDLFHARFMTLANLRGVLHRGIGAYLDYLRDNPDPLHPVRLLDDLDQGISRRDAIRFLEVVLHTVVENYEEYKDYNTTTTHSDYGENLHVLLEFLRVKSAYERHAWQFRPLLLAHEVLARRGRSAAAILLERSLTGLTSEVARQHLDQLARLEKTHGIRLGTIADRLSERFVKTLNLDRLCALIEPAMTEARQGESPSSGASFARLLEELRAFTDKPIGVGLDVPYWLRRLELEVHRVQATQTTIAALAESFFRVPRRSLSFDDMQRQLRDWARPWLPQ